MWIPCPAEFFRFGKIERDLSGEGSPKRVFTSSFCGMCFNGDERVLLLDFLHGVNRLDSTSYPMGYLYNSNPLLWHFHRWNFSPWIHRNQSTRRTGRNGRPNPTHCAARRNWAILELQVLGRLHCSKLSPGQILASLRKWEVEVGCCDMEGDSLGASMLTNCTRPRHSEIHPSCLCLLRLVPPNRPSGHQGAVWLWLLRGSVQVQRGLGDAQRLLASSQRHGRSRRLPWPDPWRHWSGCRGASRVQCHQQRHIHHWCHHHALGRLWRTPSLCRLPRVEPPNQQQRYRK